MNTYGFKVVFAGTEEDEELIDHIIYEGEIDAIKCIHGFTLLQFAELAKHANLFVGNESGPLHIAALMDTPLVGIYGPGVKDVFSAVGTANPGAEICDMRVP
jgi:ADP-heptose:LPS heptosyltransferase